MEASRPSEERIEKIFRDLASYLASSVNSLGYQQLGIEKDDLIQEIHIRIWRAIKDNNHDIKYFNAYLKKIVYSVFINEVNRIHRENRLLETGGPCLSLYEGSKGYGTAEDASLKSIILATVDGLKESKRRVLKLRLQGFTIDEIARLNRWPYRKTCSILYRGLKDLKLRLRARGISYED